MYGRIYHKRYIQLFLNEVDALDLIVLGNFGEITCWPQGLNHNKAICFDASIMDIARLYCQITYGHPS